MVTQEDWRWLKRELEPITNHRENYLSNDIREAVIYVLAEFVR